MAKGAEAKENITNKLLSTFEGSFISDKVIVIPQIENGEEVHIKVSLTCAKNLIEKCGSPLKAIGADTASVSAQPAVSLTHEELKPTQEELDAVDKLYNMLGGL